MPGEAHDGGQPATAQDLFFFPRGLPGFEDRRHFALDVPPEMDGYFCWLTAVEGSEVSFLLTNPLTFVPDYRVSLRPEALDVLGVGSEGEVTVLTTVTVPPEGVAAATTNLAAPIVFCASTRRGLQVVLEAPGYSLTHPLFSPPPARCAASGN